ncbi:MAG: AAA family ATPase [Propionibacteriaceae bacterium]
MTDGWLAPQPVRRVQEHDQHGYDRRQWPATLPAVRQLLDHGLDLGRLTILVGENGAGKSTVLEAVAMAFGLSAEGGSTGARHSTRASESDLWRSLQLVRGAGGSRWGYFVRAETMHGLFSYLEQHPASPRSPDPEFHGMSHGESFRAMLNSERFLRGGFFVLDEPEAGLSFESQLALVGQLAELTAEPQSQVLMATHSPILTAVPGADLWQLDGDGLSRTSWADLSVVDHYRRFLDRPEAYLRHVL